MNYYCHPSSYVDEEADIGDETKIWHFSHVMAGARVGANCVLGQNVHVAGGATIGNGVKIQNNVSIYEGNEIEDCVFLGPSCVLTNIPNPRAEINRHSLYDKIIIRRGATIGANATVVCGVEVGPYAFIAAGATVITNVPAYALMAGVPARKIGWMSRHGQRLCDPDQNNIMTCPESGLRYQETAPGQLRCLDLDENQPLPREMPRTGQRYWRKNESP